MFQILVLVFIAVPILEIYLLFQVGDIIGAGWTILAVIATAILGVSLLRRQGLATLTRLNQNMAQGQLPPTILIEGLLLLLAGAFLLTPGFFTDGVGFILLIQPLRKTLASYCLRRGVFMAAGMHSSQPSQTTANTRSQQNNVIEGEYERKDDD